MPIRRLLTRKIPLWLPLAGAGFGLLVATWFCSLLVHAPQRGSAGALAVRIASAPQRLHDRLFPKRHRFQPWYGGDYAAQPSGLWRNPDDAFVDPGYLLVSRFDAARARSRVELLRLRDGRVLHRWAPDIDAVNRRGAVATAIAMPKDTTHFLLMHPLLMADGGLVIHDDKTPLARVDACGAPQWVSPGLYHHALERDGDGNLWADYTFPRSPMRDVSDGFEDEALTKLAPDGRVLYRKRIAEILDENGLGGQWRTRPYSTDPFHLNDIQPVPGDGPYWRRGDVFVSLRNLSMLLLYRPSTGKVLWWKSGPWAFQHDVEVLDDHRITVFDNHWRYGAPEGVLDGTNRILRYDFADDRVDAPFHASFLRYRIRTYAQGRATPLGNGDVMVEATEAGRLLRLAPDGTQRWRYIAADAAHKRYQLRWSRYLDPHDPLLAAGIAAATQARCPQP